MSNTKNFLSHTAMLAVGFGAAQVPEEDTSYDSLQNNSIMMQEITPEVCMVEIEKREGEDLYFTTTGSVKVNWGDQRSSEESSFQMPLSQVPTQDYLDIKTANFLANLKTNKFYPASSYAAGCVAPHNRKLFDTKEAAISAGFVPSKSVK